MSPPLPIEPLPDTPWDVLIIGTGLKQSLLACALSRADKKVLQLDPNTYYGSSEACFAHLSEAHEWASLANSQSQGSSPESESAGNRRLPFSNVKIWSNPTAFPSTGDSWAQGRGYTVSLAPSILYWYDPLLEALRRAEMTGQFVWQAVGAWWVYEDAEQDEEGKGTGAGGVMGMVGEAVASVGVSAAKAGMKRREKGGWNKGRKRDTKLEEAQAAGPISSPLSTTDVSTTSLRTIPPLPTTSTTTATKPHTPILKETPNTLSDIAFDPSLTNAHRTTLASFLHFIQQSDSSSSSSSSTQTLHSLLTTTYPLPPRLINHIHALTLLPHPTLQTPLSTSISRIKTHLSSLGKTPDARSAAALLVSYGGLAEMCQVFSRGAAVAGGINVLARGVETIIPISEPSAPKAFRAHLTTGESISVPYIISSKWDLPSASTATPPPNSVTMAKGIFISSTPLTPLFQPKYPDERIAPGGCILTVFTAAGNHKRPVYIHARASSPGECPFENTLLYASVWLDDDDSAKEGMRMGMEEGYSALEQAVEKVLSRLRPASEIESDTYESFLPNPRVIWKMLYTQLSTTKPGEQAQAEGEGERGGDGSGVITLQDLSLDLPLQGNEVLDEVLGVYERVCRLEKGKGREEFLMVGEEVRRLMREGEEGE